ncbi:uncharacterized protein [Ptychodera flava]|uniref:uncharacterized protein isoform X2 n=1 Tax=Ptychodera flava TaxID=63121 RepID=UPI003969DA07
MDTDNQGNNEPTISTASQPPEYQYDGNYDPSAVGGQYVSEKPPIPVEIPLGTADPAVLDVNCHQQYAYYLPGSMEYNQYGQNAQWQNHHYPQVTVIHREYPTPKQASCKDIGALTYSIFACLFFFWPLAIVAIVYSALALSYRGKPGLDDTADRYTKYSLTLSAIATTIGVILLVVLIICLV